MIVEGSMLGHYRLERKIGQGGMAVVYLAYDPRLHRNVAIKVIPDNFHGDPEFIERFRREARAAAGLIHPNIVTVHDLVESAGTCAIVMEYMDGGTLRDLMLHNTGDQAPMPDPGRRRFAVNEVTSLLKPIASALDHAHEMGVIHRDVKPSNILMSQKGRVSLSDFGLVRLSNRESTLTATAVTVGTPEFISPEQALGMPITGATDIYSLATIAYIMICGDQPYTADSPLALLVAHAHQDPRSPRELFPEIPATVEEILLRGLARDPAARFSHATDFAVALESALPPEVLTPGSKSSPRSSGPPPLPGSPVLRKSPSSPPPLPRVVPPPLPPAPDVLTVDSPATGPSVSRPLLELRLAIIVVVLTGIMSIVRGMVDLYYSLKYGDSPWYDLIVTIFHVVFLIGLAFRISKGTRALWSIVTAVWFAANAIARLVDVRMPDFLYLRFNFLRGEAYVLAIDIFWSLLCALILVRAAAATHSLTKGS